MTTFLEISKIFQVFRPETSKITVALSPVEANEELKLIEDRVTTFRSVAKLAAERAKSDDLAIKTLISDSALRILTSALDPTVEQRYRAQIRAMTTYETLLAFLKGVFGSELTRDQKLTQARRALAQVSRFSDQSETFTVFLSRLTVLSDAVKNLTSAETAEMLARDAFFRSVTPQISAFIAEHGKSEAEISDLARFLDERQMHRGRSTANLLNSEPYEEIRRQNEKLVADNRAMREQVDHLTQLRQGFLTAHGSSVSQVAQSRPSASVPASGTKSPAQSRTFRPRGPKNRKNQNLLPGHCGWCGLAGHSRDNCPRPTHITCTHCGRRGHLESVRHQKSVPWSCSTANPTPQSSGPRCTAWRCSGAISVLLWLHPPYINSGTTLQAALGLVSPNE